MSLFEEYLFVRLIGNMLNLTSEPERMLLGEIYDVIVETMMDNDTYLSC